ncbi:MULTISPECIES: condensation domain-containing protein [Nocardia]|uniref:Condensation domain-containing protein n=1 Tax=Nocardia implantans TaxID=3108168 RepID=A0ABU6ARA2_9NOCA|nr:MULTISPECIES: hypothetical protein [unclassified Nocardia]MBF6191444.1 hypothetical protein [Nocardia beijingensis]MEA3528249.1 hypothetical protein [Nocardia sp. CDC192]MEB3510001.1 hypothetical protein [Nocardia sp. CDC186]
MTHRLTDIDCVSARGHSALGGTLAIQAVWRYDRPVDLAALEHFHEALRHGRLGRAVAPATIPAAGDRWTTRVEFSPLEVADEPIAAGDLEAWIAEQGHAELRTFGGPAWRLAATRIDNGESAVSLLVSHTLADGSAFCAAVTDAVADKRLDLSYRTDEFGRMRLLAADLRDAARRARSFPSAAGLALRLAVTGRGGAGPSEDEARFRLPTVTATVPAQLWHAAARARGGTGTTLAVAMMTAIATRLGRTDEAGRVRMMMPVSTRTADDLRANALTSIAFEVDVRDGAPADLAALRAVMKEKLTAAAAGGQDVPPLVPVAVALPRGRYAHLARQAATDPISTVCSSLGKLDPEILRIDGRPASAMMLGLVNQSLNSPRVVTERGGNLYVALVEAADQIALRVMGYHPPALLDAGQLSELVRTALAEHELTATFW